jgi:Rha family phage regulatory protein
MNGLVIILNGKPTTTSLLIAEKFNKPHSDILKVIRKTIEQLPIKFSQGNFSESDFTNERGRTYKCYEMTRDAYSLIVMGLNGKGALNWKVKFIEAFNAMEQSLLSKTNNIEWKQARLQSIGARRSVTDQIAEFVKYATEQGSKSATMYYSNITKMEYKALEMISKNEKIPKGFRDTLDAMDLSFLTTAEYIARKALQDGMNKELHYKEIYLHAKQAVFNYADTVTILKLN